MATQLVGESIARDIARQIDAAWFAVSTPKGPSGLRSLIGTAIAVPGGGYTNADAFAEAISEIEQTGISPTAIVANASTVLALSRLKKQTGSNEPLLNPPTALGATQRLQRQLLGVGLFTVPDTMLADDELWIYAKPKVSVVLREDVDMAVDESFFFGSDSLGVRATMRVDFAFPHPQSIAHVGVDGS